MKLKSIFHVHFVKTQLHTRMRNRVNSLQLVFSKSQRYGDVAKTFKGIIMALEEYSEKMKEVDARIYVRRGGPNYQKGLADIQNAAERLGLPIQVGGPETHITKIVADAFQG